MLKFCSCFFCSLILPTIALALPLTGFYQTIDDATNQPKAIVVLYEYEHGQKSELAGRIVATYDANGVPVFDTSYIGMDIIWNMKWDVDDNQYNGGKIRDPKNGKVYSSVIWQDDEKDKLNVRGKIGPFGRTQHWVVLDNAQLPKKLKSLSVTDWTPKTNND